jgi:hypothetical protein
LYGVEHIQAIRLGKPAITRFTRRFASMRRASTSPVTVRLTVIPTYMGLIKQSMINSGGCSIFCKATTAGMTR